MSARHGTGKFAPSKNGGDHYGGLVNVWSGKVSGLFRAARRYTKIPHEGNGGNGGDASSGDAHAYTQRSSSSAAYTGPGGDASGGSVFGHVGGLIDIFSGMYRSPSQVGLSPSINSLGNGGDGADASSGSAYAGGSSAKAFSGPGGDASGGSINEGVHGREYSSGLDNASGACVVFVFFYVTKPLYQRQRSWW